MHLDVCLGVCKMDESEGYRWDFGLFLILFILTLMGGVSMILGCTGGRGYPSSQMWEISHIFRVMSKMHLSGFLPNYLLF